MKISFWKLFWPAFIAIMVGFILWLLVFFGVIGGIVALAKSSDDEGINSPTILHLTLEGEIKENSSSELNPSNFEVNSSFGLSDLLYGFEQAAQDPSVKGIYVELNAFNSGIANIQELRNAFNKFKKSGKFIVAYHSGEYIPLKQYYLTSCIDENYGFPTSNFEFLGLSTEPTFYKNTLDKLGIEMQVIRGKENDFKSAVEPFLYTKMSDSSRLQTNVLLTNVWKLILSDISKDRNIPIATLNNFAEKATVRNLTLAKKHHLIKDLKFKDEIIALLKKKINHKDNKLPFHSFEKYAKEKFYLNQQLNSSSKKSIAVILTEGEISSNGDELNAEKVAEYIRAAREDKSIATVVLRINSPGGSALASEVLWREINLTNKSKKVIVSMGNVAASGGYYMACAGDKIFAETTTITGSIGVFGLIPYTGGFLSDKLGITFDEVKTNAHSNLSLNKKLSLEEIQLVQTEIDEIYGQFIQKVATGRKLTPKFVHAIARGRVWTGADAKRIGLVDEIGGIADAIAYATKHSKLKNPQLKYWPKKTKEPFEEIIEGLQDLKENNTSVSSSIKIPSNLLKTLHKIEKLKQSSGILMKLPFEYTID